MNEDELRILICKELGWILKQDVDTGWTKVWLSPNGVKCQKLPPLTLDLCHEAEKTLSPLQETLYIEHLANNKCIKETIMSSVLQRATAFIAVKTEMDLVYVR